jgi:hypothetical protein
MGKAPRGAKWSPASQRDSRRSRTARGQPPEALPGFGANTPLGRPVDRLIKSRRRGRLPKSPAIVWVSAWRRPAISVSSGGLRARLEPRRIGDFEMSRRHFSAAVAFAGLLTGSQIALAEVEEGSRERTEIFVYGGWELVGAPIFVVDLNKVAADNGADARNTRWLPSQNDPVNEYYANIPAATRSNNIDDSPELHYLYLNSTLDKDNSNKAGTSASKSARPSISTLTGSSRALTARRQAKSMSPPTGCARCVGEVARAVAGGAKSFAALFSGDFFRIAASVLPRHPVTGNARQRTPLSWSAPPPNKVGATLRFDVMSGRNASNAMRPCPLA